MTERSSWNSGKAWDQEGVSPIIATILTVAIAVVLAAAVFFITTGLTKGNHTPPPTIGVRQDDNTDALRVVYAPATSAQTPQWDELVAIYDGSPSCLLMDPNGLPVASGATLSGGRVLPGEDLHMTGLPGSTCTLRLTYQPGDMVLGEWTFHL